MPLSPGFAASFGRLVGNHLWQSTGFAAVAVLLALALRSNHARARYWLWLAASVKFLVPFSMLSAVGASLGRWFVPATPVSHVPFVVEQIVQPFAPAQDLPLPAAAAAPGPSILPAMLLVVWLCGFVAVLLYGWVRWRRVAAAARSSTPLTEGRELGALRRLGQAIRLPVAPRLVSSTAKLEPGVFGIFHPVLWLPAGIGERLEDAELEAILAHELCHIRRRDNLLAAIHMAVEALFWFHPLVWWLGARLEEERERACDEEVVRMGGEPQTYAESILKVCEFYLASPVACAAGVTGGDLRRRIEGIMTNHHIRRLGLGKRLLLSSAAVFAIAAPVAIGVLNARAQSAAAFQTASIEPASPGFGNSSWGPGIVNLRRISVQDLLIRAYDINRYQISGPEWLSTEYFDVFARTPEGATPEEIPQMLQVLLAERFKLVVHRDSRPTPVYALIVGKEGPKLREVDPNSTPKDLNGGRVLMTTGPHTLGIKGYVTMAELSRYLSSRVDRPVLDFTNIKGTYNIDLSWTPDEPNHLWGGMAVRVDHTAEGGAGTARTDVFQAIRDSLGLRLESRLAPVTFLLIDHVEKVPTEN
jgi:uncharacterized protein (TIGR03435 family)